MEHNIIVKLEASLRAYHQQKCQQQQQRDICGDEDTSKQTATKDNNNFISYGTAGFRGEAKLVERLFYNVGLISALRCLKSKANIGIMITASHNPICDNGVKLIDSNGEMLEAHWEKIVERFCNLVNPEEILAELQLIIKNENIECDPTLTTTGQQGTSRNCVLIGYDTRPTSIGLANLVKEALDSWSPLVDYHEHGLLTTPALHYLVAESNLISGEQQQPISLQTYFDQLSKGLVEIFDQPVASSVLNYSPTGLIVDCANGVGYETLKSLKSNQLFNEKLPIKLINTGEEGILNHLCGADYVKTIQQPPTGASEIGKRYASLDGDADRVVYFYLEQQDEDGLKLNLLDGDKIMALFALYLNDLLKRCNLESQLTIGCIQTAYANGASTDFIRKHLELKVDFADTGVKNLHHKALNYDFGIYFEANGHGTIWVSSKARELINNGGCELNELEQLLRILNNYTGDAISDVLIVETILRHYDWDVRKWYRIYQDRPSSLTKVVIKDRNLIRTTNAGQTCLEPAGLQNEIDELVKQYGTGARCFVRASGTENVVRIYAEAEELEAAEQLTHKVGLKVKELCN